MSDIEFVNIRAENALSFQTLDQNLENQGLVLLLGVNLDEFGAGNGSGKSSFLGLIKASFYGKYGKQKGKNLQNTVTKGPLFVEMDFRIKGHPYRTVLSYGRSDPQHPDGLRLLDLTRDPDSQDVSKKGKVEAQIARLLGIPFDVFEGAVCVGQNTSHRFVYGTNMDRQVFFGQLGGFERWRSSQEEARELAKTLRVRLQSLQERYDDLKASRTVDSTTLYDPNELDEEIRIHTQTRDTLERNRQDLRNNRKSLEARLSKLREQKSQFDDIDERVREAKELEESIREKTEELEDLADRLGPFVDEDLFEKKRTSIIQKLSDAQAHISLIRERLETLSHAGAVCPTCDTDLSDDRRRALVQKGHEDVARLEKDEKKFQDKKEAVTEFAALIRQYKDLHRQITSTVIPVVEEFDPKALADLNHEIRGLTTQLEDDDKKYEETVAKITESTSKLSRAEERLRAAVEAERATTERELRLRQVEDEKTQVQKRLDLIEIAAEEVFPGLRADSIRDLLGTLNQDVSLKVGRMFRSSIRAYAKFKPKGQSGDELALFVEDEIRGRTPVDDLSGGEGKRVVIAFMFSLWNLSAAVHRSVNFAGYDEILRDVDHLGQEQIIELLRSMRDEGKTLIVTSNQDPASIDMSLFDQVWVVRRENRISTLLTNPLDVEEALSQNRVSG